MKIPSVKSWVEALEGGEYKQIEGYLKNKDGFCCLGVACDLAGCKWEQEDGIFNILKISDAIFGEKFINSSELPKFLISKMLRKSGINYHSISNVCDMLANINDNGGTFQDIASILRAAKKDTSKRLDTLLVNFNNELQEGENDNSY